MSTQTVSIQTEVSSTFAISGEPRRDGWQILNVKKALEQDVLTGLHREVQAYLEAAGRQCDDGFDDSFGESVSVGVLEQELKAPECTYREDNSLTRTSGLYKISMIAEVSLLVA
jgi:hypothetical protein